MVAASTHSVSEMWSIGC